MDADKLKEILNLHGKWLRGEVDGVKANLQSADLQSANLRYANLQSADLRYANLQSANLQSADLQSADLQSANLQSADLRYADLQYADLRYADLRYANLQSADLRYANLQSADLQSANLQSAEHGDDANITGEPWAEYLSRVVPALLTAGGKTLAEVVGSGCWDCHSWENCPMAVAFGIKSPNDGPLLLRPRIEQFVQLFDARMIPVPVLPEGKQVTESAACKIKPPRKAKARKGKTK